MSVHRVIKKLTYAVLFWGVVLGILLLIIWPLIPKPAPEVQVQKQETFAPIVIENIVSIPHTENPGPFGKTVDVVARIKNDNARAGVKLYPLELSIKDPSGAQIQTMTQQAYVLPGGVQYVAFINVQIPADKQFGSASIQAPSNVSFMQLPDSARLPEFSVFLRDRTQRTSGSEALEQQTGIVTNNSTFDWERVEVTAVALDSSGKIVGVGKTFVGKLLIGEQREFTILWPQPLSPTSRVVAIASTNIYSDENFVHIIGDPSTLR